MDRNSPWGSYRLFCAQWSEGQGGGSHASCIVADQLLARYDIVIFREAQKRTCISTDKSAKTLLIQLNGFSKLHVPYLVHKLTVSNGNMDASLPPRRVFPPLHAGLFGW